MAKLERLLGVLEHYKYLIVVALGIALVGFLSENSIMNLIELDMQKAELEREIEKYDKEDADAKKQIDELKHNPNAVEKVARERYFMKKADEDVFVLSTDEDAE